MHFADILKHMSETTDKMQIKKLALDARERKLEKRPEVAIKERLEQMKMIKGEERHGRQIRKRFEEI